MYTKGKIRVIKFPDGRYFIGYKQENGEFKLFRQKDRAIKLIIDKILVKDMSNLLFALSR